MTPTPRRPRGRLIGWERWCDGAEHTLVHGHDYDSPTYSVRVNAQQWARRNGMKATTTVAPDGGSFTFQIIEGLTAKRRKHARELQKLAAEAASDDELRAHLQSHRRVVPAPPSKPPPPPPPPPKPKREPPPDPIQARRKKLSSDAGPRGGGSPHTVKELRPRRRRRA